MDFGTIPADTTAEEKELYLQFIRRIDSELKPGAGKKIQEALREAIAKQRGR
jgi:hypothetical protein